MFSSLHPTDIEQLLDNFLLLRVSTPDDAETAYNQVGRIGRIICENNVISVEHKSKLTIKLNELSLIGIPSEYDPSIWVPEFLEALDEVCVQ